MKPNKKLLTKVSIIEIVLLTTSAIGLNMFWNRLSGPHEIGIDRAAVIILAIINSSVSGYGLSLARRIKYVNYSVLFVLLIALIGIGCIISLFIIGIAAGLHGLQIQIPS